LPKKLGFPQLRVLNLNRNSDLKNIELGYCPLLEVFACTYCSVNELGSFAMCPILQELDVSYNEIGSLSYLLSQIKFNNPNSMKILCFNDNVFNHVPEE
jgi:Leucine-rich repeat (LRR) protein